MRLQPVVPALARIFMAGVLTVAMLGGPVPRADAASCWTYTLSFQKTSLGMMQYQGWHTVEWCASNGRITAVTRNWCTYNARWPWEANGCSTSTGTNLGSRVTVYGMFYYRYCWIYPFGCFYDAERVRTKMTLYPDGRITGSAVTLQAVGGPELRYRGQGRIYREGEMSFRLVPGVDGSRSPYAPETEAS